MSETVKPAVQESEEQEETHHPRHHKRPRPEPCMGRSASFMAETVKPVLQELEDQEEDHHARHNRGLREEPLMAIAEPDGQGAEAGSHDGNGDAGGAQVLEVPQETISGHAPVAG